MNGLMLLYGFISGVVFVVFAAVLIGGYDDENDDNV